MNASIPTLLTIRAIHKKTVVKKKLISTKLHHISPYKPIKKLFNKLHMPISTLLRLQQVSK